MSFTQEELTLALRATIDGLTFGKKLNSTIASNAEVNKIDAGELWNVIAEAFGL